MSRSEHQGCGETFPALPLPPRSSEKCGLVWSQERVSRQSEARLVFPAGLLGIAWLGRPRCLKIECCSDCGVGESHPSRCPGSCSQAIQVRCLAKVTKREVATSKSPREMVWKFPPPCARRSPPPTTTRHLLPASPIPQSPHLRRREHGRSWSEPPSEDWELETLSALVVEFSGPMWLPGSTAQIVFFHLVLKIGQFLRASVRRSSPNDARFAADRSIANNSNSRALPKPWR